MKYEELSKKTEAQMRKELSDLREKSQDLARKKKLGQVKNVHELAKVRRDIARILTFMRAN